MIVLDCCPSSLWCYRPRSGEDCPSGCTKSSFNTLSTIILFSCCYRWWWKWLFSELLQNLKCDTTGTSSEFNVWIHKRGVKCNTLGLLTQFKILASPAWQVHTNKPWRTEQEPACTATAEAPVGRVCKNHHTDLQNYEQSSWIIRQKDLASQPKKQAWGI